MCVCITFCTTFRHSHWPCPLPIADWFAHTHTHSIYSRLSYALPYISFICNLRCLVFSVSSVFLVIAFSGVWFCLLLLRFHACARAPDCEHRVSTIQVSIVYPVCVPPFAYIASSSLVTIWPNHSHFTHCTVQSIFALPTYRCHNNNYTWILHYQTTKRCRQTMGIICFDVYA